MAKRAYLAADVFSVAYDRLYRLYSEGHRLVVTMSGGKDSTVDLELAVLAARDAGRLPVEVATRDEEVMFPGTFEYLERVAAREEVSFHHVLQGMPVLNVFNRSTPFWWTFDELLDPEEWVRKPPPYAYKVGEMNINALVARHRFPPARDDLDTFAVVGIRAAESPMRILAIASSARGQGMENAHLTGPTEWGARFCRPIYDWEDGDVWKFIKDHRLDYNRAYDVMLRSGVHGRDLRIAPPTQRVASIANLQKVAGAWPRWFDRVCRRLPGVRTAVQFGKRALTADRKVGETWQQVYARSVLGPDNPEWIRERGERVVKLRLENHLSHSKVPLPDSYPCPLCVRGRAAHRPAAGRASSREMACWKQLVNVMYLGDPFSHRQDLLEPVDPEYFRPGSGTWHQ